MKLRQRQLRQLKRVKLRQQQLRQISKAVAADTKAGEAKTAAAAADAKAVAADTKAGEAKGRADDAPEFSKSSRYQS